MRTDLPIRLCVLLTLPFGAAFAQSASSESPAEPVQVRRVRLAAPAAPAEPARPLEPAQSRASKPGHIGVYLGAAADGDSGAQISQLVEGGAAEAAGLQAGDRILAIGDRKVKTSAELIAHVKAMQAGDTVRLRVDRDGWRKTIELQLRAPAAAQQPAAPEAPRWIEVTETKSHGHEADAPHQHHGTEHLHEHDSSAELEELRKLIELGGDDGGEIHVERRVWINGEELSPEQLEELHSEHEWIEVLEEESSRGSFFFSDDGEAPQAAPKRVRVRLEVDEDERAGERSRRVERREREQRMQRAERLREQESRNAERRRRAEIEREVRRDPRAVRARAELDALREELDALRGEVGALRRELIERRGR
jgi:PDZ domain-containing protein